MRESELIITQTYPGSDSVSFKKSQLAKENSQNASGLTAGQASVVD